MPSVDRRTSRRYPLSPAQQSIWTESRLRKDRGEYNVAVAFDTQGTVHLPALRAATAELLRRHTCLRARFIDSDLSIVMEIAEADAVNLDFAVSDLSATGVAAADEALRQAADAAAQPFDLTGGCLLRVRLFRRSPGSSLLVIAVHHLVTDEQSMAVICADLGDCYTRSLRGQPLDEVPPSDAFGSYLLGLPAELSEAADRSLVYWRKILEDAPRRSALPDDYRPDFGHPRYAGVSGFTIEAGTADLARRLAAECRASEFVTLLASFGTALARFSDESEVLVATPVSGRPRTGYDRAVGLFVQVLPLRMQVSAERDFHSIVRQVRAALLGGLAHRAVAEQLVSRFSGYHDPRDNPLAPASFQIGQTPEPPAMTGLSLRPMPLRRRICHVDIECYLTLTADGGYAGEIIYNRTRYAAPAVDSFTRACGVLLRQLVAMPQAPVGEAGLLDPADTRAVWEAQRGEVRAVAERPVPQLVAARASAGPDRLAIEHAGRGTTYRRLDEAATIHARRLRTLGVGRGSVVAVRIRRSTEMVVAMLAVLKSGAAYLPLDPTHPPARHAVSLAETGATAMLVEPADTDPTGVAHAYPVELDAVADDRLPDLDPTVPGPDDVAYVIYTSGSTGKPKGVQVTHRSVGNLVAWCADRYRVRAGSRFAQLSTPAFDVHVLEVWSALAAGATLCIAPDEVKYDWEQLATWLVDQRVDVSSVPAILANDAIRTERGRFHTTLFTGGEVLGAWPQGDFVISNIYGPTEATVGVTENRIAHESPAPLRPTIGRPLWNTDVVVLDPERRPVPPGAVGELHIGGVGLALGYLGQPDLTEERFVPNPHGPDRLYRTGDRARWRTDGRLEFLGRTDRQVQIRGFRVEPAEVETAVATHPGVRTAVVTDQHGQLLHAYFVPVDLNRPPSSQDLRSHLRALLPEHMMPSSFTAIAEVPLTPTGKLARDELDRLAARATRRRNGLTGPRTPTEAAVAAIWADELELDHLSVDDNLFDLGTNSLSLVRLAKRLTRAGYPVEPTDLFTTPTVAELAAALAAGDSGGER